MDLVKIKLTDILLDYGSEPLLALAVDDAGKQYLATAISDRKYTNPYLVVQINDEIAKRVKNGVMDILSAILTPETNAWYLMDLLETPAHLEFLTDDPTKIPPTYLPGSDFYVRV